MEPHFTLPRWKAGIVNKIQIYIAPKIFGGSDAKSPVGGIGTDDPAEAWQLTDRKLTVLGEDILLEYSIGGPPICERR